MFVKLHDEKLENYLILYMFLFEKDEEVKKKTRKSNKNYLQSFAAVTRAIYNYFR